ncbi:MAG: hypothetical protein ACSW8I_04680 [bacterium]
MSFGTITLLLLFLGISMYSKVRKTIAEQSVPVDDSVDGMQGEEEVLFSDEEETPLQESPYFTYEADTVETPVYEKPKAKPQPVVMAVAEETARPQFDLRQAVISQVILSNKYINGINQ